MRSIEHKTVVGNRGRSHHFIMAKQIEKLKELRKTLINDVVIGKIKVPQ